MNLVTLDSIAKQYSERLLLDGVNLQINEGDRIGLIGVNGSGKTTLLRILCSLTRPEKGAIHWRGRTVGPRDPDYLRELRYVGHADGVKLVLTPRENLRIAMALETRVDEAALEGALADVALGDFMDVPCRTLSAGQRRRVALARLVLGGPRLWLLDEPFTSLDVHGGDMVRRLIAQHLDGGGCAVLTSHQPVGLDAARTASIDLAS